MNQPKNAQTNDTTNKTILGLIILVILLIIGIIILKFILESITEEPTITVAFITGFVSIVAIILQRIWEKKYKNEQEIREKKLPIYQKLINEFSYFFYNNPSLKTEKEREIFQQKKIDRLIKFIIDNNGEIITWASDEVLKEWSLFRKYALSNENQGMDLMFQTEKIFYAIRHDLGHKNKNLERGDILRLFINDIDEVLEKIKDSKV